VSKKATSKSEHKRLQVQLNADSVVDQNSGEVSSPGEFLANLQTLEVAVQRAEVEVESFKAALKHARDNHRELVLRLRGSVRDGRVLPLFETPEYEAADAPQVAHDATPGDASE
jgi:hypothetical protein